MPHLDPGNVVDNPIYLSYLFFVLLLLLLLFIDIKGVKMEQR